MTSAINVLDHPANVEAMPFAQIHPVDFRALVNQDIPETPTLIAMTLTNVQLIVAYVDEKPNVKIFQGLSNAHVSMEQPIIH